MIRIRHSRITGLVMLCFLLCLCSCKHKVAAAPPTPTPPAPAAPETARAAAPTIALRADRATLTRGESVTLTVATQNATSVTIEPGLGTVSVNGSRQVTPGSSVTYIATAIGPGGTAGDSVRLTVNAPAPATTTPVRSETPTYNPAPPTLTLDQRIQQAMQPILFDYDKADIRQDQMEKIQLEVAFLNQNPALRFVIEGHCDDRGSEEYNQALGERRASAIKSFMVSHGLPEARFSTISYGEEKPACREETEDCHIKNRRGAYTRVP